METSKPSGADPDVRAGGFGLLGRLGGLFTAPRAKNESEGPGAFFPEWTAGSIDRAVALENGPSAERPEPDSGTSVARGLRSQGQGGALALEPRLRETFARAEWAVLEDLLWEVHAKAQACGKKELALRAQSLAEWAARAANSRSLKDGQDAWAHGALVPPQGESLLEEVILRLNHLCWIEDSVREGVVGA